MAKPARRYSSRIRTSVRQFLARSAAESFGTIGWYCPESASSRRELWRLLAKPVDPSEDRRTRYFAFFWTLTGFASTMSYSTMSPVFRSSATTLAASTW